MIQILYIEDDPEVGALVKRSLVDTGYNVVWLKSVDGLWEQISEADLVILDVMLPGLDGFTIGQRIKQQDESVPILYLTARSTIEDKITGLENADDYLTKPFHPKELLLRIDNLLKRFDKTSNELFYISHLKVDLAANTVINRETNEEILLTKIQFNILTYLLKNINRIVTKEQIYGYVWENTFMEGDKTVIVHIKYLRDKIEKDAKNPRIVETIRGLGYRIKQ